MEIKIGEYIITSDELNVVLSVKTVNSNPRSKHFGEVYVKREGYYPTLAMALNALCNRELNLSDAATVEELKQDIKRLGELIADAENHT